MPQTCCCLLCDRHWSQVCAKPEGEQGSSNQHVKKSTTKGKEHNTTGHAAQTRQGKTPYQVSLESGPVRVPPETATPPVHVPTAHTTPDNRKFEFTKTRFETGFLMRKLFSLLSHTKNHFWRTQDFHTLEGANFCGKIEVLRFR